METMHIVGCITGIIAIALGVYVSFTARRRGPIFSNTFIWLTKQEQAKTDRNREYRIVTVVFGCLAAVFALVCVGAFTSWQWTRYPIWGLSGFIIVYAIAEAIREEMRKEN